MDGFGKWVGLGALVVLTACGGGTSCPPSKGSPVRAGHTIDFGAACGLEAAVCPDGRMCATISLESGETPPSCVPTNVCDDLDCGSNRCDIAESFPGHVGCDRSSGTGTGPRGCSDTGVRTDGGAQ